MNLSSPFHSRYVYYTWRIPPSQTCLDNFSSHFPATIPPSMPRRTKFQGLLQLYPLITRLMRDFQKLTLSVQHQREEERRKRIQHTAMVLLVIPCHSDPIHYDILFFFFGSLWRCDGV